MSDGWIGVDLDGTLAHYDTFVGVEHIGEPIMPMVDRVKRWLAEGRDVRVFTARVDGGGVAIAEGNRAGKAFQDVEKVVVYIEQWCLKHIGQILPVTNRKDYGMIELWDDRVVAVEPNTGKALSASRRGLELEETIPSGPSFYIYTKGSDKKAYMMIEGVEWELPAGIEEMGKIIEERHKLEFAVKVYKQREKDTGASYRKEFERLSEERDNSTEKERIRVLGLIEDFGCSCSPIVSQSEGVVYVHEGRCPFMMSQKIRKLSGD